MPRFHFIDLALMRTEFKIMVHHGALPCITALVYKQFQGFVFNSDHGNFLIGA